MQPNWLIFILFMAALAVSFSRVGLFVSVVSLLIVGIVRLVRMKSAKDFFTAAIILPSIVFVTVMVSLSSSYVGASLELPSGSGSSSILQYFQYSREVGAGGRLAYWMSSWNTFLDSPVTGVGLGQSPFYFFKNVPLSAYGEWEVQRYMRGEMINEGLPNAKNMIFRVLAETGLVGAGIFGAFLTTHFLYALTTRRVEVTVFSIVLFVALVVDFWSLDTFALPTFWWALAILWTMSRLKREEQFNQPIPKTSPKIQRRYVYGA